jgi:hypothetical protein
VHWFQGPQQWLDHHRLARHRRHEPFTPRLPRLILERPALFGTVLAVGGIAGNWWVTHALDDWPDWMLFPSLLLATLALVAMVIGLGILTVRMLEPVLAMKDFQWDAEPLAVLGIPVPLQRKCERIGFWTAEDLVKAVERGKFPWTALEYDERMQIERAAQRWSVSPGVEKRGRGRRPLSRSGAGER